MLLFHGNLLLVLFTYLQLADSARQNAVNKGSLYRRPYLPKIDRNYTQKEWAQINRQLIPKLDFANARPLLQSKSAGIIKNVIQPQIVNGKDASVGQFPWQAIVFIDSSGLCGGSLILEQWILTAAHCVDASTLFTITLGTTKRKSPNEGFVTLNTTEQYMHPLYDREVIINDIALIKLPEAVTLTDTIALIALPPLSDAKNTYVGILAKISGFGLTADNSKTSDTMKFMEDKVVSNSECVKWFGTSSILSSSLCAKTHKKASCQGDSGGPLVYQDYAMTWRQIGVVSFGADKCLVGPSVYTRVTYHLGWISETVQQDAAGTTDADAPTPTEPSTKSPTCSIINYKTVEECCNVPESREFVVKKKSEKICNARVVDFNIFNYFVLNKYQTKGTNEIDLSDARLARELAREACFVNCYLKNKKVILADETVDKDKFIAFMQRAQRVNSDWLPIIEKAATECYDMTLAIPNRPNFTTGKTYDCDSTATLMVQCVLYKVIENCPEIRQDAKCLKKFASFTSCGGSISYFNAESAKKRS